MPDSTATVLHFAADLEPASRLAVALGIECLEISRHAFPDGESLVRVPLCPAVAVIYAALNDPNAKLIELILAFSAARDRNVETIILAAPYLPYMRQDMAFREGEAVSQRTIGALLASHVDSVVSVDPHLHRVHDLASVFPGRSAIAATAAGLIGQAILDRFGSEGVVIIGPDEESEPWVSSAADAAGCDWGVGTKHRHGDRQVDLRLPDLLELDGRTAVIVDDVISSGTTVCAVAHQCVARGASAVHAFATHALFNSADEQRMTDAGVNSVISCDGISHPSNGIALAPVLAEAIRQCL